MSSESHLKRQLIRYKDLLVNFSRKNRELYYKEVKNSSINLSKFPFHLNKLSKNIESKFSPIKVLDSSFSNNLKGDVLDLHEYFMFDKINEIENIQNFTNKLDKIRIADEKFQREFGISGAWILGPFLCWRASAQIYKSEFIISPLFKVPVDITKDKKKRLSLTCETDTVQFNQSLLLFLKHNYGIDILDNLNFDDPIEALNYFKSELSKVGKKIVESNYTTLPKTPKKVKIIRDENGDVIERVQLKLEEELSTKELEIYKSVTNTEFLLIDVLYLDQLNTNRAMLINDYDGILDIGHEHSILNELFNGIAASSEPVLDKTQLKELDSYQEKYNHFVVDIDGSQHRAIDKASKSRAIVIQGPPGTGKSQTIVNLIADYLAKGKKVLFVSEKRPALDVVFNRMKGANIESQSVLIHSSDLNKTDLYKSFLELSELRPNEKEEKEWINKTSSLDRIKSEINKYAEILQSEHHPSLLKIADLICIAGMHKKNYYIPEIYQEFQHLDYDAILDISESLSLIQNILIKHPNFQESPWINRYDSTINSTGLDYALKVLNNKLCKICEEKKKIKSTLINISNEYEKYPDNFHFESIPLLYENTEIFEPFWNTLGTGAKINFSALKEKILEEQNILNNNFKQYSLIKNDTQLEVIIELEQYYKKRRGFFDWFSSAFWSYRKIRKSVCPIWDGTAAIFRKYIEYNSSYRKIGEYCKEIMKNFKFDRNNLLELETLLKSNFLTLEKISLYLTNANNFLPKNLFEKCHISSNNFQIVQNEIKYLNNLFDQNKTLIDETEIIWTSLKGYISKLPEISNLEEKCRFIQLLITKQEDLEFLDQVDILLNEISTRYHLPNLKDKIVSLLFNKQNNWSSIFTSSVLNGWVDEVQANHHQLRSYNNNVLEDINKKFVAAVEDHKILSRFALHQSFAKRWTGINSDRSGLPLLTKEASKQKKVLSPREIMEKGALNTMFQLKPCWLMSPLSISQILPLKAGLFDVIIFDEASQVRVEDAIPSIFRAKTMIVVGDDKQMPPTTFFSGILPDDDDDEEEEISPSILDLAIQSYPSVLLEWHYRSRSEALIAFSNRAFYGGRLIAAPNPQTLSSNKSIRFTEIQDAYFKGKEGNEIEAEIVINHLIKLLTENANRSFGIIAMGISQANALQNVLENKMSENSKAAKLLENALNFKEGDADAGLFIKNLENVQGDERDQILLSIGYAPSAPNKQLRLGFGPLSSRGGGRRLNVAITRAKIGMNIFCSFNPNSIPIDEEMFSTNPELCIFGRYLRYAKSISDGNTETTMAILNSFPVSGIITTKKPSRFSLDVKKKLEQRGHYVSAEIGSSGFYIDLAIHHPNVQSNFILGIECDGAVFHSTQYARDRDKIRQNLLESRGWKIIRIWSLDWSKNWEKEILRIENALQALLINPLKKHNFSSESVRVSL